MAALCLLPVGYVVVDTISTGWSTSVELLVRPRVGSLLGSTVLLLGAGMAAAVVLGTATAWVVERSGLPGGRLWHAPLAAPLAVPAFVTSFGWVTLFPGVASPGGALLVVTLAYFPLVHLPVAAALSGLDPALEEAAAALGLTPAQVLRRVVLPQLRPAALGGAVLVGLHLLSEFGALQLLRVQTFTTAIYDQYESGFNAPAASALASVLLVLCGVLLAVELRLRGRAGYARVGAGTTRRTPARLSAGARTAGLALLVLTVVGAVGVPVASLLRWLTDSETAAFPLAELVSTGATTVGLGLAAAVLTTVLAVPVAVLAVRYRGALATLVERTSFGATALPGIVVALALITTSLAFVPGIYQTVALLLAAYAILFLPRALVSVRASVEQARPVHDDVCAALGISRVGHLLRVTLPLAARGCGAGAALVFLGVSTELTATLLLAPLGVNTLATRFWAASSQIEYGQAASYALVMVLLSLPATLLLARVAVRESGA